MITSRSLKFALSYYTGFFTHYQTHSAWVYNSEMVLCDSGKCQTVSGELSCDSASPLISQINSTDSVWWSLGRLINFPPRDTKEWKKEFNARTSAERSNKREKIDFQLESGRHRSTKMWYCRLYHIMMLQHLDAWDLPFESPLRKLILEVAWSMIIITHFFRYSDSYVYFSMSIFHFLDNIYFSRFNVCVCWLWSLRIPRDHYYIRFFCVIT